MITTASYFPDNVVTNDDLSKKVDTTDEWIYTRTGIKERRILQGETDSDMCLRVGRRLMEKSGVKPEDVGLIIVATITAENRCPSIACMVQRETGAANAFCFDLSAACSGFVYALTVANKFITSGEVKYALVIGSDALSTITDWSDRSTCVLFGDAAGGVIIDKPLLAYDVHADGSKGDCITIPHGGFIKMDGRSVLETSVKKAIETINTTVASAKLSLDQVKYIVCHQANIRIIQTIAKKMGLPMEKFYVNINRFGNTSAATIPVALDEMAESKLIASGDKVLCVAFGGGFTWGSVILEF